MTELNTCKDIWLLVKLAWNLPVPRNPDELEALTDTLTWIPVLDRNFWNHAGRQHEQAVDQLERELDFYFEHIHNRVDSWIRNTPQAQVLELVASIQSSTEHERLLENIKNTNSTAPLEAAVKYYLTCRHDPETLENIYKNNLKRIRKYQDEEPVTVTYSVPT